MKQEGEEEKDRLEERKKKKARREGRVRKMRGKEVERERRREGGEEKCFLKMGSDGDGTMEEVEGKRSGFKTNKGKGSRTYDERIQVSSPWCMDFKRNTHTHTKNHSPVMRRWEQRGAHMHTHRCLCRHYVGGISQKEQMGQE